MSDYVMNILGKKFESMPELLSSYHLVELGLYPTVNATYIARVRGQGPDFLCLNKKVLYPKNKIIEFIAQNMKSGSNEKFDSMKRDAMVKKS